MKPGADLLLMPSAIVVLIVAGFVSSLGAAAPPPSAAEQLQRMASAVNSRSFRGTLVYLHDNRLETLYIHHLIEDGEVRERLVSMTGPVRAVTREDDQVTCILPNSHPISVKRHGVAHDLLRSRAMDPELLASHYQLHHLGAARVAGRRTSVIGIVPDDDLRYGYRFYLDQDTGLPLKTDLIGDAGEPIEQVMFTSLELDADDGSASSVLVPGSSVRPEQAPTAIRSASAWRFEQLPKGFELLMYQAEAGASEDVEHFLLSDGLAAVSVYIEPDDGAGLDGKTHIGAIHAIGGQVAGHQVTVVGEVPEITVANVLAAIRYRREMGR